MGSFYYGGRLFMTGYTPNDAEEYGQYPFEVPTVFLDGCGGEDGSLLGLSWMDDSVTLVRKDQVLTYTESHFTEPFAKDQKSETVDGLHAHSSDCYEDEHLDELRWVEEYTVTKYDLSTLTKKKYKMVLTEEVEFDDGDCYQMEEILGKARMRNILANYFNGSVLDNLTSDELLAQSGDGSNGDAPNVGNLPDDFPF